MLKILLLEDDVELANLLMNFFKNKYEFFHTPSMKQAHSISKENRFDLYIFSITILDTNGILLLKKLRNSHDETPAILITKIQDIHCLTSAFEAGANDFIKKPFDLEELNHRIINIKKHFALERVIALTSELLFDTILHTLKNDTTIIQLKPQESKMLYYLYKNRYTIVSSNTLLHTLWEYENMPSDNAVRTIIKKLRKFIGKKYIKNIRGEGYIF